MSPFGGSDNPDLVDYIYRFWNNLEDTVSGENCVYVLLCLNNSLFPDLDQIHGNNQSFYRWLEIYSPHYSLFATSGDTPPSYQGPFIKIVYDQCNSYDVFADNRQSDAVAGDTFWNSIEYIATTGVAPVVYTRDNIASATATTTAQDAAVWVVNQHY